MSWAGGGIQVCCTRVPGSCRHWPRRLRIPIVDVQFAALRAIMAIDPTSPYPGSSRLPEALAWFANAAGERRAVVAMPTDCGCVRPGRHACRAWPRGRAANRGRDAIDLAHRGGRPRNDFRRHGHPGAGCPPGAVRIAIASQPRRQIPIAILAADGRLPAASRLASEHNLTIAVAAAALAGSSRPDRGPIE